MLKSIESLRELLGGTSIENNPIALTTVAETHETIFAIEVTGDGVCAWEEMRRLIDATNRWPVLTLLQTSSSGTWSEQVECADLFSRFYFKEERKDDRMNDSPQAILQASTDLDVDKLFANFREDDSISIEEYLELSLDDTESRFGKSPDILGNPALFLKNNSLATFEDVERWLFEWEQANCLNPLTLSETGLSHISWYEPVYEKQALLLMPSPNSWDVPAYINWYSSYLCNSQFIVALLREWHTKYGAELVAHFGTMLQLNVMRQPQTAEDAFHLAWQQHMIAPCTTILPGVSPRDHARALLKTKQWFLHQRP